MRHTRRALRGPIGRFTVGPEPTAANETNVGWVLCQANYLQVGRKGRKGGRAPGEGWTTRGRMGRMRYRDGGGRQGWGGQEGARRGPPWDAPRGSLWVRGGSGVPPPRWVRRARGIDILHVRRECRGDAGPTAAPMGAPAAVGPASPWHWYFARLEGPGAGSAGAPTALEQPSAATGAPRRRLGLRAVVSFWGWAGERPDVASRLCQTTWVIALRRPWFAFEPSFVHLGGDAGPWSHLKSSVNELLGVIFFPNPPVCSVPVLNP